MEVDSNNNAPCGKYSLRPRVGNKSVPEDEEEAKDFLKTKIKRKTCHRSHLLSRYRRKSANARERSRMREINEAFETLRRVVSGRSEVLPGEKTTKISTLRLAMQYIETLQSVLRTDHRDKDINSSEDPEKPTEEPKRELSPLDSLVPLDSTSSFDSSFYPMTLRMAVREQNVRDFVLLPSLCNSLSAARPHDVSSLSAVCVYPSSSSQVKCGSSHSSTDKESSSAAEVQCDSLSSCLGNNLMQSSTNRALSETEHRDSQSVYLSNLAKCNDSVFEDDSDSLPTDIESLPFQTLEEMFI